MSQKRSVNLCSVYVLPLLGLNRWSFGQKFITSKLSKDYQYIVVESGNPFSTLVTNHVNFKCEFVKDEKNFAVFSLPSDFKEDIQKFCEGKYSTFSDKAKNLIRKKSGLTYKAPIHGSTKRRTALELLALDKDPELKRYWEDMIKVKLDDDAELASSPGAEDFCDFTLSSSLEEVCQ